MVIITQERSVHQIWSPGWSMWCVYTDIRVQCVYMYLQGEPTHQPSCLPACQVASLPACLPACKTLAKWSFYTRLWDWVCYGINTSLPTRIVGTWRLARWKSNRCLEKTCTYRWINRCLHGHHGPFPSLLHSLSLLFSYSLSLYRETKDASPRV